MARYAYSASDGRQEPPTLCADDILNACTPGLLQYGDLNRAMQELLRRGDTSPQGTLPGFESLRQQLEMAREACLHRYAADSFRLAASQVHRFEEQIKNALAAATDVLNRCHDALPAGRSHRQAQDVVLQQRYRSLQQRLEARLGAPPPGRQTEVSQHLKRWLGHVQPDTQGDPVAKPHTAANLLRHRAQFLRRHHVMLTALERYLDRVQRLEAQLEAFPFCGVQTLGVEEAAGLVRALHDLEHFLQHSRWHPDTLPAFNLDQLHHLLQQADTTPAQRPEQIEALLQQAGLLRQTAQGLSLTPKGIRQIGARALHDIFRHPQSVRHSEANAQRPECPTGTTKPYSYGDPLRLHLGRTFDNATRRQAGIPVRLHPDDFEVYRHEPHTPQATVLMLDMSQSMAVTGQHRFAAAKKVALALAHLIQTRFPQDILHIVGFGTQARQLQAADLPYLKVGREHTNTQQGLRLARRLLGRQRSAHKQFS